MKIIKVSILLFLLITFTNLSAQSTNDDGSMNKINLVISKLMINNHDLTDSLRIVNISNGIWLERNKNDKEIGRAKVIKDKDNEIHVKWMHATNGAKRDGVTIYKIKKQGEKYTFEIYYNNKKQGYFIGKAYD